VEESPRMLPLSTAWAEWRDRLTKGSNYAP